MIYYCINFNAAICCFASLYPVILFIVCLHSHLLIVSFSLILIPPFLYISFFLVESLPNLLLPIYAPLRKIPFYVSPLLSIGGYHLISFWSTFFSLSLIGAVISSFSLYALSDFLTKPSMPYLLQEL